MIAIERVDLPRAQQRRFCLREQRVTLNGVGRLARLCQVGIAEEDERIVLRRLERQRLLKRCDHAFFVDRKARRLFVDHIRLHDAYIRRVDVPVGDPEGSQRLEDLLHRRAVLAHGLGCRRGLRHDAGIHLGRVGRARGRA